MRARLTLTVLAALCCLGWAAEGGASVPQQSTAVEQVADDLLSGRDAITIPEMLSYQGKLLDSLGIPVPDTTYSVRFRLYTQASGGSHYWEENQTVRTEDGLFSVLLGSVTAIPSVPDAGNLYLGMAVAGGAEMSPRLRIVSAAYSHLADKADSANYAYGAAPSGPADGDLEGSYPNPTVGGLHGRTVAPTAPAQNQVLKWQGNVWTPADDSVGGGGGGGTVTSVSQGTGVTCAPNPITATGSVSLDRTYTDNRYVNEGQAAGGDLTGTYPDPDIADSAVTSAKIADDNVGVTDLAHNINAAAIGFNADKVDGRHYTDFVWNQNSEDQIAGFRLGGEGRASKTGSGYAALRGESSDGDAYGVTGHSTGWPGVGGWSSNRSSDHGAVYGLNTYHLAGGAGVHGQGETTYAAAYGVRGEAGNYAVLGISHHRIGVVGSTRDTSSDYPGVVGVSGGSVIHIPSFGSGATGCSDITGVYGHAANTSGNREGGLFFSSGGSVARVAAVVSGTNYKIHGVGNVSCIMPTRDGTRTLFAPELPEPFFEDIGHGQLENGSARVDLDPLFLDCIQVDDEHPLKVFVQLNDDCGGVFVKTDETGFDVRELQGGTSNAAFTWRAIGNRADTDYLRLPHAPEEDQARAVPIDLGEPEERTGDADGVTREE